MIRHVLGLCAVLLIVPVVRGDAATLDRMKKDLFFLAGEECEGRGLKTEGIHKAATFIANEFKVAGLKAPFENGSYFQPFGIRESYIEAGPHRLLLTGPEGKPLNAEFPRTFSVTGLSGKGAVGGGLVFVGFGISSEKYDDYKGLDVKNQVVVMFRQYPGVRDKENPFFTEEDSRKHSPLAEKLKLAAKYGAAAVVFVNDRDMAGKDDPLMEFSYASEDGKVGTIPVLHARRAFIDQALASLGTSLDKLQDKIEGERKAHSLALTGWSANIQASVGVREIATKNVIGVLEGRGPLANETVVIGAHYDHLGRGEKGTKELGSNAIHYGADDNGSGTTGLLELARRFTARKDYEGRRIVFIAFSGEERGLFGSLHYCEKPVFPLKDTVAMLNMDMIGRLRPDEKTKKGRITIGGVGSAKNFEKLLDDANAVAGFQLDKVKSGTGPSDHTSFYLAKVPVYFFFTGDHAEYHTPKDRPETINYEGILKVSNLVDDLASTIARAKERPEYVAGVGGSMSGGPSGPKLGVMPRYDDAETRGMEIGGVVPGGAAEQAGLKKGDRIISIGGKPVQNVQDYMKVMSGLKRGEEVEIAIERDDKKLKVKAVPK